MNRKLIIQTAIYVFFVSQQPVQTKTYVYQSALFTFEEARKYCQNNFPKGDLAIIEYETSKEAVTKFLEDNLNTFRCEFQKYFE